MTDRNYTQQGRRAKKKQRDRYWSLMLVGDHGRVIPFKRFKGIAISFIFILVVTLLALTILSFLYWRQANKLALLTNQLLEVQDQADALRDEKDVLLTRLVIEDKLPIEEIEPPVPPSDEEKDNGIASPKQEENVIQPQMAPEKVAPPQTPVIETPKPPKKEPPKIKLGADIKDFKVTYDHSKSILQAKFRVFNANQPKTPLAGRVVVVFKMLDDPPMKWITVPTVQISNSIPDSQRGQIFKIRNFRTMTLKAFGLNYPIPYNTAAVFVFSDTGDLILNQEYEFKITAPPAVKSAPKPVADTESEIKTVSPPSPPAEEGVKEAPAATGVPGTEPTQDPLTTETIDTTHYPDPYSKSVSDKPKATENVTVIREATVPSGDQPSDVIVEETPPISSDTQEPDSPKQEEQQNPQSTR